MPRKGENIYKRKDGRWEGRYIRGYHLDGKVHFGYVYGKTYKETKEKLTAARASLLLPDATANSHSASYESILNQWLESTRINVKESTYARYYELVHKHIIPAIGKWSIERISTAMIEQYVAQLLDNGRIDGSGGLAPKTASDILVIIKSSMEYARENGYAVFCNLNKLYIKKEYHEMRVLSAEEQQKLQAILLTDTDSVKLGVLLSLFTGIRIGEVCALRWEHLCLDRGILEVRQTMQRMKIPVPSDRSPSGKDSSDKNQSGRNPSDKDFPGRKTKIIITEPKSISSIRDVPLPQCIIELAAPLKSSPDAFVLTGTADHYMEPRTLQNRFRCYLNEAGISHANYHALRHTFATHCIELGFDVKTLSEILGHSSVNLTLNRYVHSSFEQKKLNMEKLEF